MDLKWIKRALSRRHLLCQVFYELWQIISLEFQYAALIEARLQRYYKLFS
jgi:hypothetical protein